MRKLFLIMVIALMGWGYESISNAQLKNLSSKSSIIDIRTPSEWKETGVIEGSHLITFFQENGSYDARGFLDKIQKENIDKKPLVIICRSGNRSVPVSDFLTRQGFKDVYNVKNGIIGWISEGRSVVKVK